MSGPLHTVHVRVNDAATGQPTPCRVRFIGPEGEYLAPFGRLTNFATRANVQIDGRLFAYIDGTCEIELPAGQIIVHVSKGPEYTAVRHQVTLPPGQLSMRLQVERWIDMRQQRWYAGDSQVHCLTPHAALLEGEAEDIAVVNLLATECEAFDPGTRLFPVVPKPPIPERNPSRHPAIPNILAFSGQRPALASPQCLVVVNTLNTHPQLGRLSLLNCHRIVFPLSFGGPEGLDNWSLADWCDQCHRKGGLVAWADDPDEDGLREWGEALANLMVGRVDAFSVTNFMSLGDDMICPWYGLLQCGFHVPLVGGSGKDSNAVALGSIRTYARLEPSEELSYQAWIEAVRAGRTFVTQGPLLLLTVEGQDPGWVIKLPATGGTLHVRAEASSLEPFERVEILVNGKAQACTKGQDSLTPAVAELNVQLSSSSWIAARCCNEMRDRFGKSYGPIVLAYTSPVYVELADRPMRPDEEAITVFLKSLDSTIRWIEHEARVENNRQRERLIGIVLSARAELVRRAAV